MYPELQSLSDNELATKSSEAAARRDQNLVIAVEEERMRRRVAAALARSNDRKEAICAALGSVFLYLAISVLFENSQGRALTTALSFFMFWLASTELRTGIAYIRSWSYKRSEHPGMYWYVLVAKALIPFVLAAFFWTKEQ